MRVLGYHSVDVVNGPGTRCTLFVSGCDHRCGGCFNKGSWSFKRGELFNEAHKQLIISDLQDTRIRRRGLSLSGGDPLHPANVPAITDLLADVRKACPDKDIWCWTGYVLEELNEEQRQLASMLDVLVDGRFEQALKDPSLWWRGSSNQRIWALSERYASEDYCLVAKDYVESDTVRNS
ncbi:anaerobic ribonucleoside-triphosphate reductase-activating protein [Agaribacterium sp. ZY112]|uniref:anaerobic ribonucleoside-triphosphate reductase-activating protein n=1 Tax=Agaribacterium sp. ZY112 TaxID=3233574 RepID=UPI003524C06A